MHNLVIGFTYDRNDRADVSTSALVFMVHGQFAPWKQAVCFSFTTSNLKATSVIILFGLQNSGSFAVN